MNEKSIRTAIETGHTFGSYPDYFSLEDQVRFAYNDALKLRGQGYPDAATSERCVSIISRTLYEDYPNLYDNEFPILLQAGVSGELGKDTWVSGATVLQWIRLYSRHQTRLVVIDEAHKEAKSGRLTKEEIAERNEKAFHDGMERGRRSFAEHGTIFHPEGFAIPRWPAMIYEEFRRRGVIPEPGREQQDYAAAKAETHDREHPVKVSKPEFMALHKADITKAYLLEAYFVQDMKKVTEYQKNENQSNLITEY